MPAELEAFHQEFFQDVQSNAHVMGVYSPDAFFDLFCEHLVDAGELDTADRAFFEERGLRIDGYGGDPNESERTLSLIVSDFHQSHSTSTLTATEMTAIFKRASNFVEKALQESFRRGLEETSPVFGLADLIAARWPTIAKIRFLLLSNRVLSARVDGRDEDELDGIPVTYSVWDLERLFRFVQSGRAREEIEIDMTEFGGSLPAIRAHLNDAEYEAYLAVVPGAQLAAIYDRWGARLLEQNVRVFLQARGKVNKGIRTTIENEPPMFFAYNNGITATAESVETEYTDKGLALRTFKNLQIVNGGQTTASIYTASKKKTDLSQVFVQMKLSIVSPGTAEVVVPKISEYANSQNRVSAADFFSNHPFHIRMEEFSRRILAPSKDGTFRESKWFYERARGQYQDARSSLTAASKKKFELENPKRQVFSKTDLAKFVNVWRQLPHIVSKGAQKNFAEFATFVGREWKKNPEVFNELYFREAIAKAIIFRHVERLVSAQPWYEGGYRANIVAHAIAKLACDIEAKGNGLDFGAVWQAQDVSQELSDALLLAATAANHVLTAPPAGMRNVTEWGKQQACWNRVKSLELPYPKSFSGLLLTTKQIESRKREGVRGQRELNGIEAQKKVLEAGATFWLDVKKWGQERRLLTAKETSILQIAGSVPIKLPSEKQAIVAVRALRRLQSEGCPIELHAMSGNEPA